MREQSDASARRGRIPFTGPDFIVIGAMKCGTSSLWSYLDSHPNITMSNPKETDFFRTEQDLERGMDWYRSCFERSSETPVGVTGEASPNYTKAHVFPGVPERIVRHVPSVKLVYLVRDPIERLLSHYVHNVAAGRERQPIDKVIGAQSGYVQTSMYARQLRGYRAVFPDDALLVVDAAELESRTKETVADVLRFVGVTTDVPESTLERRHHRSSEKRRPDLLQQRLPVDRLRSIADRALPEGVRGRVDLQTVRTLLRPFLPRAWTVAEPVERPRLTDGQRDSLADIFRSDVAELRAFTGLPFRSWAQ